MLTFKMEPNEGGTAFVLMSGEISTVPVLVQKFRDPEYVYTCLRWISSEWRELHDMVYTVRDYLIENDYLQV